EAHDVTARERKEIRAFKKVERERERRRRNGVRPRAEYLANALSRTEPWKAEAISQRTWQRRRKAAKNRQPKACRKSEGKHLASIVQDLRHATTASPPAGRQQAGIRGGHGPTPGLARSYEDLPVEIRLPCLCLAPLSARGADP